MVEKMGTDAKQTNWNKEVDSYKQLYREILQDAIDNILKYAAGEECTINGETIKGKKRGFTETIEAQITLKNYSYITTSLNRDP